MEIIWSSLIDFDLNDLIDILWKLFLLLFFLYNLLGLFAWITEFIAYFFGFRVDFDDLLRFFGIEPRKDWGAPDRRLTERVWRKELEDMKRRTQERRRIQELV